MTFNWSDIRSLEGSQNKGFEELCAQLARDESPDVGEFRRKGSPDAGVECYCILPDGIEWGWQAKYFDVLGNPQWRQLDKSVRAALDKHPKLVRYYICVPLDRSDARTGRQHSAMQRWDARVKKWCEWANERGMCVEFIWWGSSELIERLSENGHVGRRYFWFGEHNFDQSWFQARLDEAISAAGPRYTPEIHIDLPIARDLEAFARSDFIFDGIKSLARGIRNKFQHLRSECKSKKEPNEVVSIERLSSLVDKILAALAQIEPQPIGELTFTEISGWTATARDEADMLKGILSKHDQEYLAKNEGENFESTYYQSPFRNALYHIRKLCDELDNAQSQLEKAHKMLSSRLMILQGKAGTGKTHLLCDFAKKRTEAGLPTILLMGQRFLTSDPPWTQASEQLDLSGVGLKAFIGALEAAAQAADCRVLLIVDALNEGLGRLVWPGHLAPFLEALAKSSWIGVLLSVRSEYESFIFPSVPEQVVKVTHNGFADREYDATQAIFSHFGLEFPSTPVLQPEFRNPLLLKTVCEGLKGKNARRLPRGFHGISAIFDLYLEAINRRLAQSLGFNPGDRLVNSALTRLAAHQSQSDEPWIDRRRAEDMVNELLPGRTFQRSLYQGLVTEGLLTVAMDWRRQNSSSEVVYITYERFADHLMADSLLQGHLDMEAPQSAFEKGGQLEFICDSETYVPNGLLEALCVQVPERVGQELLSLVPSIRERPGIVESYLQSIIWRRPDACLTETKEILEALIQDDYYRYSTLDALLTVATIEGHPLNAEFLDNKLCQYPLPDRDAWWSTSLHYAWSDREGPVHRLVDWASSMNDHSDPDETTVELCSIVLAWTFTSSNRFLRDRATKALVSLLTGRLDATTRLIDRFAHVDDLYVAERVYAVAYGVAMRSPDSIGVGQLASVVYHLVFANGVPPVHILLRDYARGVVERAIYLESDLNIDENLVRPPYRSVWPRIPEKDTYEAVETDTFKESDNEVEYHWAKRAIVFSIGNVFSDFCNYVIGDQSSWLSLSLDEEPWQSHKARMVEVLSTFNEDERTAYDELSRAVNRIDTQAKDKLVQLAGTDDQNETFETNALNQDPETVRLEQEREHAYEKFIQILTSEHLAAMEEIAQDMEEREVESPQRFDTKIIQRYILFRVFDLGWTTDRFGEFDSDVKKVWLNRDGAKPERLGKKYQWIAYHEILAYIADHYQYREKYNEDKGANVYEGPWQDSLRDIDPSCTLPSIPGGTSWDEHSQSWWSPILFEDWGESLGNRDWIAGQDDTPDIEWLLSVRNPSDGTSWLNVDGFYDWRQPHPPDYDPYDIERRDFWLSCTGYFLCAKDVKAFMEWAQTVDFWGRWMPESYESHEMFLGECIGSSAFRYFCQQNPGVGDWTRPANGCPVLVLPATLLYSSNLGSYDCSVDDSFTLRLPDQRLVKHMGQKWFGKGADFVDSKGNLAAFDPTVNHNGPSSFLVREDVLRQYLSDEGLGLCWTILGEKRIIGGRMEPEDYQGAMKISGAYSYTNGQPRGFLSYHPNIPNGNVSE